MIPCYDVALIWHVHHLHSVSYKETTNEMLGKHLHHDDTETGRNPGSKLYDFEARTRALWKAEGLQYEKPGTT